AIEGTGVTPEVRATGLAQLLSGGIPLGDVQIDAAYEDSLLTADAAFREQDGGVLRGTASIPTFLTLHALAGDSTGLLELRPMTGSLTADGFEMSSVGPLIPDRLAQDLEGRLDADAGLAGALGEVRLEGGVTLSEGAVTLPMLGLTYEDVGFHALLDGREVRIDRGAVSTGDGSAEFDGALELGRLPDATLALEARFADFLVANTSDYRAAASGTLRLGGSTLSPRLDGALRLQDVDINLADLAVDAHRAVELTPEDYRMLEERFGYSPDPPAPPMISEFLDAAHLDVSVDLSEGVWVRRRVRPQLSVELTGEIRVLKEPGNEPTVEGAIEPTPQRSQVTQFERKFEIVGGTVAFGGPLAEAQVDIDAEYEVPSRTNPGQSEVVIGLKVEGTPDELSLVLSSDPAMDNGDIVSYIATGRPAGGNEGLTGEAVATAAVGGLSEVLEGAAQEAVGLDVMEIRYDGLRGATLVAGRYVSPDLYLGFKQPVAFSKEGDESTSSSTQPELELEYEAYRWLLLNLQGGRSGFRFFLRSRYGY
ncbi:MAG: translocation/assembly module TamB domain-containing protein, partial [Longimicrobiales bacterium]